MGYGTVKTLTDTSMRNCVGDMRAFGPTIMTGFVGGTPYLPARTR